MLEPVFCFWLKALKMDRKHPFPLPRRPPAGEAGQAGMNSNFPRTPEIFNIKPHKNVAFKFA